MTTKILTFIFLGLLLIPSQAQIRGKKSKDDFIAIDKSKYSIGDIIEIGYPSKGNEFQSIVRYTFKSFLDKTSETLNALKEGDSSPVDYLKLADKSVSNFKASIKYFKI